MRLNVTTLSVGCSDIGQLGVHQTLSYDLSLSITSSDVVMKQLLSPAWRLCFC